MDDLIARLEASRAVWTNENARARSIPTELETEAAAALRAYAEREKELVEALKEIALLSNNNRANKKMLGDKARTILSKHKEQK
jgi:hypothetical protein